MPYPGEGAVAPRSKSREQEIRRYLQSLFRPEPGANAFGGSPQIPQLGSPAEYGAWFDKKIPEAMRSMGVDQEEPARMFEEDVTIGTSPEERANNFGYTLLSAARGEKIQAPFQRHLDAMKYLMDYMNERH